MKVTATVVVRRPSDSALVVLTAGDELPGWATELVTNPAAVAGSDGPSAEWTARELRAYAEDHGVDLGDARSKKDILDVLTS